MTKNEDIEQGMEARPHKSVVKLFQVALFKTSVSI